MTLILWNCNSIRNKTYYLDTLVHEQDSLVIVLAEIHLHPQVSNHELKLSGYEIFRRDRPTTGGGILVAIRSIKGVQVINSFSETSEEMLILRLSVHGFSFCMVAYYLPPWLNPAV